MSFLQKKLVSIVTLFLILLVSCHSKNGTYVSKKSTIINTFNLSTLQDFIPKNYSILDSISGNINFDNYTDLILILKLNKEDSLDEESIDTPLRPCLILCGTKNNKFKLIARNDGIVLCKVCGGFFGDPYTGLELKNGKFTIYHFGGSNWKWTKNLSYTYNQNKHKIFLECIEEASYNVLNISDENQDIDAYIEKNTKRKTRKNFGEIDFETNIDEL